MHFVKMRSMTSIHYVLLMLLIVMATLTLADYSISLDDDEQGGDAIIGSEWDAAEAHGRQYRAEQNALQARQKRAIDGEDDEDDEEEDHKDDGDDGWVAVQSDERGAVPRAVLDAAHAGVNLLDRDLFLEWGSTGLRLELSFGEKSRALGRLFELVRIWGAEELVVGDRAKYRLDVDVVNPLFKSFDNYASALNELGQDVTLAKFAKWSRFARDSDPKYDEAARRAEQEDGGDDAEFVDFDQVGVVERSRQIRAFLMAIDPTKFHMLIADGEGLPGEHVERWLLTVLAEPSNEEGAKPIYSLVDRDFQSQVPVQQVFGNTQAAETSDEHE
jgi:hypothetical protein